MNMFKQDTPQFESFKEFRWFFTSQGTLVIGGKSDDQNEKVLKKFLLNNFIVLHTSEPGSGFVIIQNDNPSKQDIKESAIFCACFSQNWKKLKNKNNRINVDIFKREQMYKTSFMKKGTFGVKGKKEIISVNPKLYLIMQKGVLRSVSVASKNETIAIIQPGTLSKKEAVESIRILIKNKFNYPISNEEIEQAIPSDKLSVSLK